MDDLSANLINVGGHPYGLCMGIQKQEYNWVQQTCAHPGGSLTSTYQVS